MSAVLAPRPQRPQIHRPRTRTTTQRAQRAKVQAIARGEIAVRPAVRFQTTVLSQVIVWVSFVFMVYAVSALVAHTQLEQARRATIQSQERLKGVRNEITQLRKDLTLIQSPQMLESWAKLHNFQSPYAALPPSELKEVKLAQH
jgi:hypothetical protein